jgi:hypothetical protein
MTASASSPPAMLPVRPRRSYSIMPPVFRRSPSCVRTRAISDTTCTLPGAVVSIASKRLTRPASFITYARGNPLFYVDPSGALSWAQISYYQKSLSAKDNWVPNLTDERAIVDNIFDPNAGAMGDLIHAHPGVDWRTPGSKSRAPTSRPPARPRAALSGAMPRTSPPAACLRCSKAPAPPSTARLPMSTFIAAARSPAPSAPKIRSMC